MTDERGQQQQLKTRAREPESHLHLVLLELLIFPHINSLYYTFIDYTTEKCTILSNLYIPF